MTKKIFSTICTIVSIIFTTFAVVVVSIWAVGMIGKNGSLKVLVVQTGSMQPLIPVGSLIVTRPASSYQIGDVVTYRLGHSFVTHRIISAQDKQFRTQGDATTRRTEN